jgi:hypothetical protein
MSHYHDFKDQRKTEHIIRKVEGQVKETQRLEYRRSIRILLKIASRSDKPTENNHITGSD